MLRLILVLVLMGSLSGCGVKYVQLPEEYYGRPEEHPSTRPQQEKASGKKFSQDTGYKIRPISEQELSRIAETHPDLTYDVLIEILARLNRQARYYVRDNIRDGTPIRVPNNFLDYRNWTPLPRSIPGGSGIPKLILVSKDTFFLGWYERGKLAADTQICIGQKPEWTEAGIYKVLEKDPDHYSRSYTNALGGPAWMPSALRVYGTVWIHGGDVAGGYCSHGCITVPLSTAKVLFEWTPTGTPVIVLDSLSDLDGAISSLSARSAPEEPVTLSPYRKGE